MPPEKQGAAMGLMGIVFGLAPAIGPTFSGWMVDSFSWRYIFGLILPITMIVLVISLWTIKNVIPQRRTPLDILSVVESTIGFGSLLYGFSAAGNDGWLSGNVIIAILIGVVVIGLFGYRQLHIMDPLLNLTPFKARNFTLGTLVGCGVMAAMIGFEIVLPMYLQIIRGLSAIDSGLSLLAGALVTALMSPIAGMAVDKYGAKRLLVIGMSILTIGTVPFAFVTTHTSIVAIIVLYAVRTFGISLSLMPASTLAFAAAPMNLMGHASANNNVARQIASAVATAVLVSVFANVTKVNMPTKHLLTVDPLAYKHGAFDALLSGYHVAFWLTALMSLIGIGLALLAQERSVTESVSDNAASTDHTIATEQA
ncbi:MFS transporter [Furfurilactobacillus milii]|uniref:MFS transporter n=1 Tax=Furfurilactobacillus rossiae TaxID=231049 RepID=A0A7C9NT37_9LACO|nr:MFS transporter [Furfurilactobacillus milii]MYV05651.1 MFS transporter [Furfurilactobacillus milii]